MNTNKIEKLKKSLSNNLLPADLRPKIEAEIKRLEELDSKQPTKRGTKRISKAKPSRTTKPKPTAMSLAKEIRKDGESWTDAVKRAGKMMKEKTHTASKDVETELSKLAEGGYLTDPTFGNFQNQVFADGGGVDSKKVDKMFELAKKEILEDIQNGTIDGKVNSFQDLYEYVDANCYGGLCETDYQISKDNLVENELMQKIDMWIKRGGLKNKKFADGGAIKNQYAGRTPEDVWNNLTTQQRNHFIIDHKSEIKEYKKIQNFSSAERFKAFKSNWSDLDKDIKEVFTDHIDMGQYSKGGNINEKTQKMRKQKLKKGDTVFVIGRRWFDRANGNTYHTAEVEVNGQFVGKSRMTYGYGDNYLETAKEILLEKYDFPRGMTERSPLWQLRDNGVVLNKSVIDGLKRDLAKGGGVRKVGNREYPLGRNWTNDHRHINKSDDHEVKYTRKKKFELGGTIVTDLAGHTGGALGGDPTILDGVSGTSYTGLVGETGAMSSGEMFESGGTLPNGVSQSYMVTEAFGNPAQHYEVGGGLPEGASQSYINYYLGEGSAQGIYAKGGGIRRKNGQTYNYGRVWTKDHNEFDKGSDHEVKYRSKKSFFAKGGAMENIKYADVLEVLKEKLEDSLQELPREYEASEYFTGEEVEKESRDGFIAYTDGGYEVNWFESMSMFSGSGYSLPTKPLDNEMQRQIDFNYKLAKELFEENYPEIVRELGEENIDYNSLYEAGYEDEAEQLSEWEMDNDGDDTIFCEIGAYYYDTDNYRGIEGKHTIRLFGYVNLESPYHRRGNLDDSYDIDITFDSISELKEKVDAGLKEIIEWFDGKYYNDSNAEMKIRRMAKGGGFMNEKYNISFNYNPSNLKNEDAEKIVSKYTKNWRRNNDFDEVSFFVMGLNKEQSLELSSELKMEDVYNLEIDKSKYANGGMFDDNGGFMDGVYAKGGKMAKGGKVSPFKNIMETNTITEKEINLIKLRMNNDKVDEATQEVIDYIWDNSPQLTPDQNKKGIDYLRNLWKSPTGKERTNNPFGYREQDALETFEYFELRGFYDAGNRYRKFYVPLYTCVGADSSFEYAFYNGEVNILG